MAPLRTDVKVMAIGKVEAVSPNQLEVFGCAVAMLKDRTSEIAMIAKAGDATLYDSKMEAAKSFNAASEVPHTTGEAGWKFDDSAVAMFRDITIKIGEVTKAPSELGEYAGDDAFVIDDGTVKAASTSPFTGLCPSISSNKSVEYNVLGSIMGRDDRFSTGSKSIMSADSIEVSHMCSLFLAISITIHTSQNVSLIFKYFDKEGH